MVRFEHLFYCMIITFSVFTFILNWHTTGDKQKHVHLRTSVKKCELDATCDTLETCHHNMCVHFWPMSAAKTRACHSGCEQDVRLSEDHFYLKNITDVKPFEGISKDTCVISYRVVGTTPGLSVSEYERQKRGSFRRTELLDDINVALCTKMKSSGIVNKPVDHAREWLKPDNLTVLRVKHLENTKEHIDYVLTGVLKNIVRQKGENHLRIHIRKLLELGRSLGSFHLILYENDSSDNTRSVLKSMLSNNSVATLLFEDNIHTNGRTHAIARARNNIMEHVETHFSTSKYMIMTDMDGVCGAEDPTKSYDPEVFKYVVSRSDEWDALSFRNRPYWDLWAFRHSEYMPYNKFGSKNHLNKIQVYTDWDTFFGHETDFFPVDSAFMMLAIYKISFIMGIRYSGTGIHGEADCEHVAFHRDMKQKKGARVMVSPLVYCEDGKGYKNITQKHEQKTVHNIDQITIKNNMGFNRDEPCDIPCHYTTSDEKVDATVYELRGRRAPPSGISVYMQMEGEHYYPIDTTGWTVENTYRWSSPLLKPYFEWVHYHGETDIQSKRVTQDAISGISFLARNCGSRNNREQVVQDLIQQVRVDAMSSCLHNHDKPPEDKNLPWISNKIKLLHAYKFHAAFENGNVRDYVTEKVYTALAAGTVPIYMGAPNIDEFVPKGSIIRVDSFEDTAALAKHIQECLTNETLYQSYHDWRDRPLNSEFVEKFAFTNVTTECRTCRWVYAHKHGLPWDKKSQTFEMPEIKTEVPLPSLRHVDPNVRK